jgi:pimeloyl-ACP methyl ester carboxylesterase
MLESGGDDSWLYYQDFGKKGFEKMLAMCRREIKKGNGKIIIPESVDDSPISYQSLYDTINPDGDYNTFPFNWQLNGIKVMKKKPWREIQSIKVPTLIIYGGKDEFCYGKVSDCVDLIRKVVKGKKNFQFEIVLGADHGFYKFENKLADKVVEFLTKN